MNGGAKKGYVNAFGAITAGGLVLLLADFITVSSAAPKVTLMIAIGVGLDYSLLIVTRYRQFLKDGYQVNDAVGMALATAGKAAMFAGITVAIALLGLLLVPIPLVRTLGVAAAIGVGVMILAALTLLPALFGLAGHKIDSFRFPFAFKDTSADPESSFWGKFATRMSKRPWTTLVVGTVVLLICAIPFLSIDFGIERDFASQADGGGSEDTVFIRVTFKHLGGIGISQGVASQSGDQP